MMAKIRRRCKRMVSIPPLYRFVCQTPIDSDRRDRSESGSSDGGDDPPLPRPVQAGFIVWPLALAQALILVLGIIILHRYEPLQCAVETSAKCGSVMPVEKVAVPEVPDDKNIGLSFQKMLSFHCIHSRMMFAGDFLCRGFYFAVLQQLRFRVIRLSHRRRIAMGRPIWASHQNCHISFDDSCGRSSPINHEQSDANWLFKQDIRVVLKVIFERDLTNTYARSILGLKIVPKQSRLKGGDNYERQGEETGTQIKLISLDFNRDRAVFYFLLSVGLYVIAFGCIAWGGARSLGGDTLGKWICACGFLLAVLAAVAGGA